MSLFSIELIKLVLKISCWQALVLIIITAIIGSGMYWAGKKGRK